MSMPHWLPLAEADPVRREGALMVQQAYHYVYPDKKLTFQYTTSSSAGEGRRALTLVQ